MSEEDKKNMDIANCRICTLCQNHCADCPLNRALKLIEPIEIYLPNQKKIEREIWKEFEKAIEVRL